MWKHIHSNAKCKCLAFFHLSFKPLLCGMSSAVVFTFKLEFSALSTWVICGISMFFSLPVIFFLCLTEAQAWGRRSSMSATLPAVGRFTGRRPISELTCAGTAERDPSSATGCSAGRGSLGAMSYRDTGGHTQVRGCSHKSAHHLYHL